MLSKQVKRLLRLQSVGPATVRDLLDLGVDSVEKLATQDPEALYERLCRIRCQRVDICCQDVFHAAVAQAKDPDLPLEQRRSWYWSRLRKQGQSPK